MPNHYRGLCQGSKLYLCSLFNLVQISLVACSWGGDAILNSLCFWYKALLLLTQACQQATWNLPLWDSDAQWTVPMVGTCICMMKCLCIHLESLPASRKGVFNCLDALYYIYILPIQSWAMSRLSTALAYDITSLRPDQIIQMSKTHAKESTCHLHMHIAFASDIPYLGIC